jgi:hypothetical protein
MIQRRLDPLIRLTIVGVCGSHMREHLRGVDARPVESRMREDVDIVP